MAQMKNHLRHFYMSIEDTVSRTSEEVRLTIIKE